MALPGETEAGSAGKQPCPGIVRRAHRDDDHGRGNERLAPTLHPIGSKDPDALKIPARRAASTLTRSVRSPVLAEPAHKYDIPDSAISTSLRQNVGDGGVDAQIDQGSDEDDTGRLKCPSAWQYKAEDSSRIRENSVCAEIQKHYATELVEKGYGYRVCVCNELTPEKKEKLDKALNEKATSINPSAKTCYVLSASDLAEWANRLPGVVGAVFNRPVTNARHWHAWETGVTTFTPEYVVPPGWEQYLQAIRTHIRFPVPPADPILTVQGSAGVGKTRLVFEAIRQTDGASQLVVVTNDEKQAQEVGAWLVNQGRMSAILVADECSVRGRVALRAIVQGSESRIRVMAIDNTGEPPQDGAPGIWLESIPAPSVEKILEKNFEMVPQERRRAYADLSRGYIRLAADLCKYDHEMYSAGSLGPGITRLEEYYRARLSEEDQQVVEAVSLLHRVGWKDDVAEQLECLAKLTEVDPNSVRKAARRLKDVPGFLASTPRYVYVTPQIIAEIAFQRAWRRWAKPNRGNFVDRIAQPLRSSFELRVRGLANQEVRSFVSAHFRKRVEDFVPTDLACEDRVEEFLGLLETDPTAYLPQLERLIRDASNEQLLAIKGGEFGGTGVRRGIVWAAERLAPFPEYFPSAELILRKLALAETEPGIGNNATGIWRQLFRVYLPGTAVPFLDRFPIFREVVLSSDPTERDLALGGLDHLMVAHVTRMSSPSLVGGRIPPADWTPKTQEEWDACLSAGMALIEELLSEEDPLASAAWNYLIVHLRTLLSWGSLSVWEASSKNTGCQRLYSHRGWNRSTITSSTSAGKERIRHRRSLSIARG